MRRAAKNTAITNIDAAYACGQRKLDGAAAITRLLNALEPGGARVQCRSATATAIAGTVPENVQGWAIDKERQRVMDILCSTRDPIGPLLGTAWRPRRLISSGNRWSLGLLRLSHHSLRCHPPHSRQSIAEALDYLAQTSGPAGGTTAHRGYTLAGELQLFQTSKTAGAYQDIQ